jgi:Bifunctional DNA primase/polymerase, N-terminal
MTTLDQARALRDRGMSVFRIPLGTKVPDTSWKAYQERLATDDELVAWFTAPANIGIVTGAISDLVVVDVDSADAVNYAIRRLPYTPWQTKTPRGYHLYFAHPGTPVANRGTDLQTRFGPLPLHVRGDGGYVLAPGSQHPSGALYYAVGRWHYARTALPRFWPGWLQPVKPSRPRPTTPAPTPHGSDFLLERARRYLAAIPLPVIGQGSDAATLSAACRLVRGFAISASEAEQLLWEWCGNRDGWDRAWVSEKVANALTYGTETIGGLR